MSFEPCPNCGIDLDDGDIFDKLRNNDLYNDKTDEEVMQIAHQFGWTQQNKKRFSKKVVVKSILGGSSYTQCPHCNVRLSS